jgi:hypothetical protein
MARITAVWVCALSTAALGARGALAGPAAAGPHGPSVTSITVCGPGGAGARGSCPPGSFDTLQVALGPAGGSINEDGVHGASDEHASVFPPGSLHGNSDYRFFVASGTDVNPDIGVVVLSGGPGPDQNGQWTMDFAPGYGSYNEGFGTVFLEPIVEGHCPNVADPTQQDQTFDLDYAASGSVVADPTDRAGHLLMVYEGANTCVGNVGGRKSGTGAYITTGIATSLDDGHTWPAYRGTPTFDFVPLPYANKTEGPNAPFGALGTAVCLGTDCTQTPPSTYGRYAVLSPPTALASLTAAGQPLADSTFDSEPSAFVDDASPGPERYIYEVHKYGPGSASPPEDQLPDGRSSDLTVARAQLNGGSAPLQFYKWDGHSFSAPGLGGHEVAILPDGAFENCGDVRQSRSQGSISYVDVTQQYLLTFVCNSPGDPINGSPGGRFGSAWFWATSSDLSDQTTWSTPLEVVGSWAPWDTGTPPGSYGCPSYTGWYPTFMSLHHAPGRLTTSGYVFGMWGCLGGSTATPPKRRYSSRQFTITTDSGAH